MLKTMFAGLASFLTLPALAAVPKADNGEEVLTFRTTQHDLGPLAFNPAGTRLALFVTEKYGPRWTQHQVWVYDLATGKRAHRLTVNHLPIFLGYRPDGQLVTCVRLCREGFKEDVPLVQRWDRDGNEVGRYTLPAIASRHRPEGCYLSPRGERLVYVRKGGLEVYDPYTGKQLSVTPTDANPRIVTLAWSADARRVAVIDTDSRLTVYDLTEQKRLAAYAASIRSGGRGLGLDGNALLCFPRRGGDLLTFAGSRQFRRFDALTGEPKAATDATFFRTNAVGGRWLSDGKTVVAADYEYGFALFNVDTGTKRTPGPLIGIAAEPRYITVSQDERLVGWCSPWHFTVWRLSKGRPEEP
ncbi:MAG: WD40 repeat domain-containing protein [Gemmataceae bacterium]